MPNITTNYAITYTNPLLWKIYTLNCVFDFQRICLCIFVLKNTRKSIDIGVPEQAPASRIETFLFVFFFFQLFAKQKGLQVKKMLNHNLFPPFLSLSTVVICLQVVTAGLALFFFVCMKGDGVVRQTWFGAMPVSYGTLPTSVCKDARKGEMYGTT